MRIRNPNGSGTLEVTKGAYREIYAHLGWVPDVEPKKTPIPHANEEEENPHESHEEQPEDELELQNEDQEDHDEENHCADALPAHGGIFGCLRRPSSH